MRSGIQIKYDGSINYGSGLILNDDGSFTLSGYAFLPDESKIKGQDAIISDTSIVTVITSEREYAETMKAAADFSLKGFGANAQANFAMNSGVQFQSKQVTFYSKRKIDLGFHGYFDLPHFSETAKEILRTQGPEEFKKRYGTHFVVGSIRGASMTAFINTKTQSSSTSSSVSASLRASWSGFGAEASGGFSFGQEMQSSNSLSFSDSQIFYSGQDVGTGVKSLTAEGIRQDVLDFPTLVHKGQGLALVIRPYEVVPDYFETLALEMPTPLDEALEELQEAL